MAEEPKEKTLPTHLSGDRAVDARLAEAGRRDPELDLVLHSLNPQQRVMLVHAILEFSPPPALTSSGAPRLPERELFSRRRIVQLLLAAGIALPGAIALRLLSHIKDATYESMMGEIKELDAAVSARVELRVNAVRNHLASYRERLDVITGNLSADLRARVNGIWDRGASEIEKGLPPDFRDFTKRLGNIFSDIAAEIKGALGDAGNFIVDFLELHWETLKKILEEIIGLQGDILDLFKVEELAKHRDHFTTHFLRVLWERIASDAKGGFLKSGE